MLRFRWSNVGATATAILCFFGLFQLEALHVAAYTPASPSNDTAPLRNLPQDSIQINWLPNGQSAYINALSQQLVNLDNSKNDGYRGALVRFTGINATVATDVPWIALVSCDADADIADMDNPSSLDVFSMAKDAGARTAILYSLSGSTCALESNFVALFNGTMDVYVTTSRMSALAILRQFGNVGPDQLWYDGNLINSARSNIDYLVNRLGGPTVTATTPSQFGTSGVSSTSTAAAPVITNPSLGAAYLVATVYNSENASGTINTQQSQGGSGRSGNTGLAMIILYAITGCVTMLFLVVIISGAVRAIRHPERYGPRARNRNNPGDAGQSRAGGLTKAILDTFPVVKFLSGGDRSAGGTAEDGNTSRRQQDRASGAETPPLKDEEAAEPAMSITVAAAAARPVEAVPMYRLSSDRNKDGEAAREISHTQEPSQAATLVADASPNPSQHAKTATDATLADGTTEEAGSTVAATRSPNPGQVDTTDPNEVNDSITCPICLLDFEDGDDIRILPCDSRHRFHDACVVPWLLNVSSLCPLCRLDLAKDAPTSAIEEGEASGSRPAPGQRRGSTATALASELRRMMLNPGRSARASAVPSEAPLAESSGAEQDATVSSEPQAPSSSRFMRYVQQRRNRVRAGSVGSSSQVAAPRTDTGAVPPSPNLH